jgi:hypothetical protein
MSGRRRFKSELLVALDGREDFAHRFHSRMDS